MAHLLDDFGVLQKPDGFHADTAGVDPAEANPGKLSDSVGKVSYLPVAFQQRLYIGDYDGACALCKLYIGVCPCQNQFQRGQICFRSHDSGDDPAQYHPLHPPVQDQQQLACRRYHIGLILPALGWPFGVFLLRQFMQTLPTTLIEASRIDGCSEAGIFARIILPLAKPGLGALAIFTFVRSWNDYIWQTIVLKSEYMLTLPLGIQIAQKVNEVQQNYGVSMAGAALATLPVLIVFISFQKYFTKGIMLGAVKG